MIPELITGIVTLGSGLFLLALATFGWPDTSIFLEPAEEPAMKGMLFLVGLIGGMFFGMGLYTLATITG